MMFKNNLLPRRRLKEAEPLSQLFQLSWIIVMKLIPVTVYLIYPCLSFFFISLWLFFKVLFELLNDFSFHVKQSVPVFELSIKSNLLEAALTKHILKNFGRPSILSPYLYLDGDLIHKYSIWINVISAVVIKFKWRFAVLFL